MTVIENLLAVPPKQSGESLFRAWFAWRKVIEEERGLRVRAREVLEQLRLTHLEREYAGNLSGGQKKLLELGRTMMIRTLRLARSHRARARRLPWRQP
jgi:branched-chain amino acid transport system ATP-binding protein